LRIVRNKRPFLPFLLAPVLFLDVGAAHALGLGELRSDSYLGEPLKASIEVVSSGKEPVDSSCFRLRQPAGDHDVPWLRRASLALRKGQTNYLEIRSDQPANDPALLIGVVVGCGYEIQRDYTLLLSPRLDRGTGSVKSPAAPVSAYVLSGNSDAVPAIKPRRSPHRSERVAPVGPTPGPRSRPQRQLPRMLPEGDRLVLMGPGSAGEPMLKLAGELLSWGGDEGASGREAQRELLRLEFRMLQVLNDQATSQLATAEKLREMESTLGELHRRAGEFAQRVEQGSATSGAAVPAAESTPASVPSAPETKPDAAAVPPVPTVAPVEAHPAPVVKADEPWFTEMTFYGLLIGAVLGIGGWFGWRYYRSREPAMDPAYSRLPPELIIDPKRQNEDEGGFDTLDFPLGPASVSGMTAVDVHLDIDEPAAPVPAAPAAAKPSADGLSQFSVSNATVDEHFEVNPVMELAEIMLSFGRVKGAAQALQEYIDNNPQEALQPWIRLLDVYRLAGMRDEFEQLSLNLNKNFNVELQAWTPEEKPAVAVSPGEPLDFSLDEIPPLEFDGGRQSAGAKAESLEDMPHIRDRIVELWGGDECVAYLNQLLRDNRGGKRSGFPLSVVQEILLLIDVQDTIFKTAKEAELAQKEGEKP